MAISVADVLRQSGFSEEQIQALDRRAMDAFNTVASQAEQERQAAQQAQEAAELAQRANRDFYDQSISPALTQWDAEKSRYDAELAYHRAQTQSLKDSGFLPADPQPRDSGTGRYVSGVPGSTPGSPTFDVNQIYQRAGDAVGILTDIQWEHQKLFGQPLPISPTELVRQADAVKLDPRTYAARTYNWDTRRKEIEQKAKDDERAAIVKEVETRKDREYAERFGSNPDIRRPVDSRYAEIARARRANEIPDPLMLNDQQRRAATASMIRKDMAESESR